MQRISFSKAIGAAAEQLSEGAFLISGDKANPMTVGWATFGVVWGKPICTVFVRHSRYSHELMEKKSTFTLSVPEKGAMKAELGICGRLSGRDVDKLTEANMSVMSNENGGQLLSGCKFHFVCKTVAKTELDMNQIDESILDRFYNTNQATEDGDPHTVYFAEIIETYES